MVSVDFQWKPNFFGMSLFAWGALSEMWYFLKMGRQTEKYREPNRKLQAPYFRRSRDEFSSEIRRPARGKSGGKRIEIAALPATAAGGDRHGAGSRQVLISVQVADGNARNDPDGTLPGH